MKTLALLLALAATMTAAEPDKGDAAQKVRKVVGPCQGGDRPSAGCKTCQHCAYCGPKRHPGGTCAVCAPVKR